MGVLTICRVFGLGLAGAFGGLLPFGGLIILGCVMVLTYRAYRHLHVLRIALPLAVPLPRLHGRGELGGRPMPWVSACNVTGLMIIVRLAALARPIYRS